NRGVFIGALGEIGGGGAVDYLIREVQRDSYYAIEALFHTGRPKALPVLEKHLDKLRKSGKADELDLATNQIAVLRLKHKDPRGMLLGLAEDRKQSDWMRTGALQALGHYDVTPHSDRLLRLYRADTDDRMRMFCIRLLCDLPGIKITEAMI